MSEISEMVGKKLLELADKYFLTPIERSEVADFLLAAGDLNERERNVVNEFMEWGTNNFGGKEIPLK
jgi:hypothetical protein